MIKTLKLLAKHVGENAPTKRVAIGEVVRLEGQVVAYKFNNEQMLANLSEEVVRCVSFDDDRLMNVFLYEIQEVQVPYWLDADDYIKNRIEWEFLWGLGCPKDFSEPWQTGLLKLPASQQLVAIKLLKQKTFRSIFRQDIRDKISAWLDTNPPERKFSSPLSNRQWSSIVSIHDVREADRLSNSIYRRT